MEDDDEFERLYGFKDGVIRIEDLDCPISIGYTKAMYNIGEKTIELALRHSEKSIKVKFCLLGSWELNAQARKVGDIYYIGLNFGSYLLIEDMYTKMLATKSVLKDIGNSSIETDEKYVISVDHTFHTTTYKSQTGLNIQSLIKDAERKKYAHIFMLSSIYKLWKWMPIAWRQIFLTFLLTSLLKIQLCGLTWITQ